MKEINSVYINDKKEVVKVCNVCKKELPIGHYNKSYEKKSGLRGDCRHCQKLYAIMYMGEEKNVAKKRECKLIAKYGITIEDYDTLFDKQKGCCAICGKHNDLFKRGLHVDHCHKTKVVRGLLCVNCNTALGHTKDDVEILKGMIKYLEDKNGTAK